jgi:hypothetical protein
MSDTYRFPARMFHQRNLDLVIVTSVEEMDDYSRRGYLPDWHRLHPLGWTYCDAGWRAFHYGRWRDYCMNPSRHIIGSNANVCAPALCDEHFQQVAAAGLVTEQNLGESDFYRRYGGPDRPV